MRTELQRLTARLNGAKSRGPVTARGKLNSSRNSRRHGLYAREFALSPLPADRAEALHAAHLERLRIAGLEARIMNDEIDRQRTLHPDAPLPTLRALALRHLCDESGVMEAILRLATAAERRYFAISTTGTRGASRVLTPEKTQIAETNPVAAEIRTTHSRPAHATCRPRATKIYKFRNDPSKLHKTNNRHHRPNESSSPSVILNRVSAYAIETEGLTKVFRARFSGRELRACDDISIRVPVGSTYGLLGPNGAGKTTFVKTLLSCTHPTAGRALVFGRTPAIPPPAAPSATSPRTIASLPI